MKAALRLGTRKEAEIVAGAVVRALEERLADNIGRDGFYDQARQPREILDTPPARHLSPNPAHRGDEDDKHEKEGAVRGDWPIAPA